MEPEKSGRSFLKDTIRKTVDFSRTAQNRGLPPPPIEKPFPAGAARMDLPGPGDWRTIPRLDVSEAIRRRQSHRAYRNVPLGIEETAFLLWATQGIRQRMDAGHARRTVPSAGCRHAFETYLCVFNVQNLEQGVYRYLPLEHQLLFEFAEADLPEKIIRAAFGQPCAGRAAATFVWSVLPARMEWRYGPAAYKVIALDAGHVCQNLYLACEAIDAGTCAIAAYDQEAMDRLLRLDGDEEFVVYVAPVGKQGGGFLGQ